MKIGIQAQFVYSTSEVNLNGYKINYFPYVISDWYFFGNNSDKFGAISDLTINELLINDENFDEKIKEIIMVICSDENGIFQNYKPIINLSLVGSLLMNNNRPSFEFEYILDF